MTETIVFMGTPDISLPTLEALANSYHVAGVVTQPDRPAGRGQELTPPPVKKLAQQLNIPVIQPKKLRETEAMQQLRQWKPDLIVVVAFGQILRQEVLDLPNYGCINVHASLLPRWRGAAPIQAAIMNGDNQTGVTIMKMDPGIDTGPILVQKTIPLLDEDTAGSLSERIGILGSQLLLEALPRYVQGELKPVTQDDASATYAPLLNKQDGELDFNHSAIELERLVRAFNPWPGTYIFWKGQILKVHRASAIADSPSGKIAYKFIYHGEPAIMTAHGSLVFKEVQPAGKKTMPGKVFLNGARDWDKSTG